jgi:hypothetical protein
MTTNEATIESRGPTVAVGRAARSVTGGGLILVMVLGSLAVWTAVPLAGLWVASQLAGSHAYGPTIGTAPALAAILGIPIAMILLGRSLRKVENAYLRVTGKTRGRRVAAWRRSVSDIKHDPSASVLDAIMTCSVITSGITFLVWFFFLARPGGPA